VAAIPFRIDESELSLDSQGGAFTVMPFKEGPVSSTANVVPIFMTRLGDRACAQGKVPSCTPKEIK